MKTKLWTGIIVLLALVAAGIVYVRVAGDANREVAEEAEVYTCPMHPSVRSDRPGVCPVCGMALVRKSSAGASSIDAEILKAISLSPTQRVIANISTVPVVRDSLTQTIDAVGVVTYAEPLQATVAARFRGRIEKLNVNITGEQVARGQPLFELYSPDLISAQRELLLALDHSGGSDAPSASSLLRMSALQQQMLEAARERLAVHYGMTDDQIRLLEETGELRNTAQFMSPISGTVISKAVVEGDYVDEGMVLYQLADLSRVWIMIDVYESDLHAVRMGQRVLVMSQAYPGEVFNGTVTFIDPVLNADTRTVRVRTEFANRNGKLKPNMYVTARISRTIRNILTVPVQGVITTGERSVVWVEVGENAFEPREVTTGPRNESVVSVLSGLSEGDVIAATGGYLIDSESALQMPSASKGLHAGHGASEADEPGHPVGGEVHIHVEGGYSPRVIYLKKGTTTKLNFFRTESAQCTEEVVLGAFGLRAALPEGKHVVLDVTPQETGEFVFSCGMNMIHGKIVVEE